jgi:hypothetical protein
MLCGASCPTGTIQPALAVAGVEGFWTPVVVRGEGGASSPARAAEACPTGAIPALARRKTGYDGRPPVRIGTAFVDRGRCLPWAMATPCIVCEEMCPTDPRPRSSGWGWVGWARGAAPRRGGAVRCVGCGICEPLPGRGGGGDRVSSVGETRRPLNRMVLDRERRRATVTPLALVACLALQPPSARGRRAASPRGRLPRRGAPPRVLARAFSIFAAWFGAETCIGAAGRSPPGRVARERRTVRLWALPLIMGLVYAMPIWRRGLPRSRTSSASATRRSSSGSQPCSSCPARSLRAAQVRGFGHVL